MSYQLTRSLVFLLSLLVAQTARGDEVDDVKGQWDADVQKARDVFDRALTRTNKATVRKLLVVAEKAAKRKDQDVVNRAFTEILRIDRDNSIAQAHFEKLGTLDHVLTRLALEWRPLVVTGDATEDSQIFYESMLGTYNDGQAPFVNLAAPYTGNIENVTINKRITQVTNGNVAAATIEKYSGEGLIAIPETADYVIVLDGVSELFLDDKQVANAKNGPVVLPLQEGVYRVRLNVEDNFEQANLRIVNQRSKRQVQVYNSLADIKKFLHPPTDAHHRIDISRWSAIKARALKITIADGKN